KLANAVLRRIERDRQDAGGDLSSVAWPEDALDTLALRYSHPRWLVARWVERYGLADTERLLAANDTEAPVVVRPYGIARDELVEMLRSAGVGIEEPPLGATWARDSVQLAAGTQ